MYERDGYIGTRAPRFPSQPRLLLLSSKLDPKMPNKYAEILVDVLDGANTELVKFNYSTQESFKDSLLVDNDYNSETCGMRILVSYVSGGGDLELLDKSCLQEMLSLNLTTPINLQHFYLATDDAYDGAYDASLK